MILYELECTNQDGCDESSGIFFSIKNAEREKKKLDAAPGNKKYGIVQRIIELYTDDELPFSRSDEQILSQAAVLLHLKSGEDTDYGYVARMLEGFLARCKGDEKEALEHEAAAQEFLDRQSEDKNET